MELVCWSWLMGRCRILRFAGRSRREVSCIGFADGVMWVAITPGVTPSAGLSRDPAHAFNCQRVKLSREAKLTQSR